jgi:hypothetical protein
VIRRLTVLPRENCPYELPQVNSQVIYRVQDAQGLIRDQAITIQAVVPDWGPRGVVRIEGTLNEEGALRQAIGYYRVGSREDTLGLIEIQEP